LCSLLRFVLSESPLYSLLGDSDKTNQRSEYRGDSDKTNQRSEHRGDSDKTNQRSEHRGDSDKHPCVLLSFV
jgi:hypothetical protein